VKIVNGFFLTIVGPFNSENERPNVINIQFFLMFSIHPAQQTPVKTNTRRFDCSVDYFPHFRRHLDCNNVPECEKNEDKGAHCFLCMGGEALAASENVGGDPTAQRTGTRGKGRTTTETPRAMPPCPFCPGGAASPYNGKCYSFQTLATFDDFRRKSNEVCAEKGGQMAVINTHLDYNALDHVLRAPHVKEQGDWCMDNGYLTGLGALRFQASTATCG
jgi:hypothetical protein